MGQLGISRNRLKPARQVELVHIIDTLERFIIKNFESKMICMPSHSLNRVTIADVLSEVHVTEALHVNGHKRERRVTMR